MKINVITLERVHGGWVCKVVALVHTCEQAGPRPVIFMASGVWIVTALVFGYVSAWWRARKMESFNRWQQKDHGWQ